MNKPVLQSTSQEECIRCTTLPVLVVSERAWGGWRTRVRPPVVIIVMAALGLAPAVAAAMEVTSRSSEGRLAGVCTSGQPFAFEPPGKDTTGFAVMVGSVTIGTDGSIRTGALDFRDQATVGASWASTVAANSCVSGTVATTGAITVAADVIRTLNFTRRLDGAHGFIVESDSSGCSVSGEVQLHDDPTASQTGGSYAFGFHGANASGYFAPIGASCGNAQGEVAFLEADFDVKGTIFPAVMGAGSGAGTVSAPGSHGRLTRISPLTEAGGASAEDVRYIVNGSKAFVIVESGTGVDGNSMPPEIGLRTANPRWDCLPLGQGGSLANASLGNSVFAARGPYSPSSAGATEYGVVGVLNSTDFTAGVASLVHDGAPDGRAVLSMGAKPATYRVSSSDRGPVTGPSNIDPSRTSTSCFYLDGVGSA